jgi:hypothetical protein
MELHLHRLHWEHRLPDWPAAAVAGFVAGAVLMLMELAWTAFVSGADPWQMTRQIAAIVMGWETLQSTGFDALVVAVALLTHYALGVGFGLVLGWILAGFRLDANLGAMLAVGVAFGLVLYLVDFHLMVRVFPWFESLRGWPTLAAHLVFGAVAALMYWQLGRRGTR